MGRGFNSYTFTYDTPKGNLLRKSKSKSEPTAVARRDGVVRVFNL